MVAVFVLDEDRRCAYLNVAAEGLTGFRLSEAKGKFFDDIARIEGGASFDETPLGRALRYIDGDAGEATVVDKAGRRRPVAFKVVMLSTASGGDGGNVVELVDLTGETGTGRVLRESEERLRLAVTATGIGIWDVDAASGRRRWSPEFLAILGLPADSAADQDRFTALIHPDDRDRVVAEYERAYTSPEAGDYHAEFRIHRADTGEERWVVTTGRVAFDRDGRPLRGVGTLRDTTERKQAEEALRESEERLRMALAAGRMGTWHYDLNSGAQDWDERQYEIFGLDPSLAPTRDLFLSVVHPEDMAKVVFGRDRLPSTGKFLDSEFRIVLADGRVRWITAHSLARHDATGRPIEVVGVNWDITDRKQAEEERELLMRELHHRVKNTLALAQAIVSQTLRTAGPEDAYASIQARLMALSNTHNLLNATRWVGAPFRELIETELKPHGGSAGDRIRLVGEAVEIEPRAAVTVGMVIHELATNAAKYGALSVAEGRLDVAWSVAEKAGERWLTIDWRETGGPPVATPKRRGFGSRLIERSIEASLSGSVVQDYAPGGVHCRIAFPLRHSGDEAPDLGRDAAEARDAESGL